MNRYPFRCLAASLAALFFAGSDANAQQLTAQDLSAMVQSTASDTDAYFLYLFSGQPQGPSQTLAFNSTGSPTSWSGSFSGPYFGQDLSMSYTGATTGFPPGTVSWNATGTFGAGAVSGTGSAAISYPTATTFDLAVTDSLTYGANTYAVSETIPGTLVGGTTIMFGSPGDEEVGIGTLSLDGTTVSESQPNSYTSPYDDGHRLSDIHGIHIPFTGTNDYKVTDQPDSNFLITGSFTTAPVPESPTLFVDAMVLLPAGVYSARRVARRVRRGVSPAVETQGNP
jgi:hypothetical protein